jgi:hypothetical protein
VVGLCNERNALTTSETFLLSNVGL